MDRNEQISTARNNAAQKRVLKWMLLVLQGAIIGAGAILPGVSGGVLCVVFGIYQPMMALLAHPLRTFKKYVGLLLPVLIGWGIGFLLLARLVDILFKASSNFAEWLFIGLIAGMVPSLFREAGKEGRPKSAWISLIISTASILALLFILQGGTQIQLQPNIWWYFVCGILWGISLVVPGLSSSSLLIFLGLYQPMNAGIKDLSPEVLIPMMLGVLIITLTSARGINYIFKKHYAVAYHMVIGFVIASTVVIILPMKYSGVGEVLLCVLSCAVGFAGALLMDVMSRKFQPPAAEPEE